MKLSSVALLLLLTSGYANAAALDDLKQGDAALAKGEPQRALQLIGKAIAAKELNVAMLAYAHLKQAEAYTALGDPQHALQSYTRVVEINPRNPLGYSFRGQIYMQLGQYDKAVRDFSRVIALDPRKATGWNARAMARLSRGDLGGPLEDLRHAIEVEPNNPVAYYFRANLYFYQGNYAAAAEDFRRHAELVPGDAYTVIKLYLTMARSEQGARQRLEELAKTVTDSSWPRPIIDLYLGKVSPQSILDTVETGATRAQKERACEAYFYVAYHYLLTGDQPRARELFEKAVATGITDFNEYKTAQAELWRLPGNAQAR